VKIFVYITQMLVGDVGVDLRGGNAGVAEHYLDGADVRAV